jgi:hypothetical protein
VPPLFFFSTAVQPQSIIATTAVTHINNVFICISVYFQGRGRSLFSRRKINNYSPFSGQKECFSLFIG